MFATFILVAVLTGCAASSVIRDSGHGRGVDVLLALIGSGIAWSTIAALGLLSDSDVAATAIVTLVTAAGTIATHRRLLGRGVSS
jgi:uncharacterized membrane protein YeaQ/YmgE (transglycosylase-associated protein family)